MNSPLTVDGKQRAAERTEGRQSHLTRPQISKAVRMLRALKYVICQHALLAVCLSCATAEAQGVRWVEDTYEDFADGRLDQAGQNIYVSRDGSVRTIRFGIDHASAPVVVVTMADGSDDPRTRNLIAALQRGKSLPRRIVYISTTGVYGDCGGACHTCVNHICQAKTCGECQVCSDGACVAKPPEAGSCSNSNASCFTTPGRCGANNGCYCRRAAAGSGKCGNLCVGFLYACRQSCDECLSGYECIDMGCCQVNGKGVACVQRCANP